MSQRDLKSSPAGLEAHADTQHEVTGLATEVKTLLSSLAAEIEEARSRQSRALEEIESRILAAERSRTKEAAYPAIDWDRESAEALTQAYESMSEPEARARRGSEADGWLQAKFNDLSHHVRSALAGVRQPSIQLGELDDRMSRLHASITRALEDVARRQDLEGLQTITAEVEGLSAKLDDVQKRLQRLDQLEAGLTDALQEMADTRLSRLLEQGSRIAQDLEAMTKQSIAEMHASYLGTANAKAAQEAERYDDLRALIEVSIQEWRQSESNATSVVQDFGSLVSAQADRYDELKGLVETLSRERRQSEDQTVAMLDTLQEGLVRILDRLDTFEAGQTETKRSLQEIREVARAVPQATTSAPPQRTPIDPHAAPAGPSFERPLAKAPAEPTKPAEETISSAERPRSPVERARRDLVAEAQRAKFKAANAAAEAENAAPTAGKKPAVSSGAFSGNLPRLLAAVLAGVVLINGGLLVFGRKSAEPPAVTINSEPSSETPASAGGPDTPASTIEPDASGVKPRSELEGDFAPSTKFGYGFHDDVLESPDGVQTDPNAAVPSGLTLVPPGAHSEARMAAAYQNQVIAGLSGEVGLAAARSTPDALLPDVNGRIMPEPEFARLTTGDSTSAAPAPGRASALDLPPATVGPLSLRLAAAGGDPSAQFEVASRLAEGKGTPQNLDEAVRWYQRAAAQGFAQAHYRLGTLLERGLGVPKDLARARVWYERAAEQGNVRAMHNLAVLSAGGVGEPDYATAVRWFGLAAEHGLADSQFNLGVLTENGLGTAQDRAIAFKWYALAAKSGDKDAAERRDALKETLTPDLLKKAEALTKSFKARPVDPIVNDPHAAGQDWKKRANEKATELSSDLPLDTDLDDAGVVQ